MRLPKLTMLQTRHIHDKLTSFRQVQEEGDEITRKLWIEHYRWTLIPLVTFF